MSWELFILKLFQLFKNGGVLVSGVCNWVSKVLVLRLEDVVVDNR